MDYGIVIAISGATLTIVGVMATLFLWVRGEASADRRHFMEIQAEDRKDMVTLIRSMESEMKDFHSRLLEIEKVRKTQ